MGGDPRAQPQIRLRETVCNSLLRKKSKEQRKRMILGSWAFIFLSRREIREQDKRAEERMDVFLVLHLLSDSLLLKKICRMYVVFLLLSVLISLNG